ncbi:unnamed protein product [Arctia plantaginis]|uniref:Lipase domain-containing protein n=2 Tax=Arctia plantaginis TaxID=874455 RepID=A0A8S0ZIQ5_ARCPL|nr:unnamed protein product [Arctia plantaginis]
MTHWLFLMSALLVSSASANIFSSLGDVAGAATKEVAAVIDPVEKTAMTVMFGQCKEVKQMLGLDHKNIQDDRNLTLLTVDFFTKSSRVQLKLTELSSITSSELFKPKEALIVFLHGFTDNPDKMSSKAVVDSLLKKGAGNILALDASAYIDFLYLRASTIIRFIGEAMGKALADMVKVGLDPAAVHLVGHSLGSHIAGFAGKTVLGLTGSRIGRISGLDPAGPCFVEMDKSQRLSKNDADYVDVIHTDSGVFGMEDPLGHADYYPNRGTEQPGCMFQVCSHDRAWLYFSVSVIYPRGFPAIKCRSWKDFQEGNCDSRSISLMGYGSQPGTEGRYYLQTADKYPYMLSLNGVKYVDTEGIVKTFRNAVGLW